MSLTRDILNSPALTSFLNHLTECGKSQSTEDEYSQQKKRFIAFSIYLPKQQVGFMFDNRDKIIVWTFQDRSVQCRRGTERQYDSSILRLRGFSAKLFFSISFLYVLLFYGNVLCFLEELF